MAREIPLPEGVVWGARANDTFFQTQRYQSTQVKWHCPSSIHLSFLHNIREGSGEFPGKVCLYRSTQSFP